MGRGPDLGAVRTYNSAGKLNDDNADNWSIGIYNQPLRLTGTLNESGSTLVRTGSDGAESLYRFFGARDVWPGDSRAWDYATEFSREEEPWAILTDKYVSTDGDGAYDTIEWDAASSQFVWTDGATGTQERYEGTAAAKLLSRTDADGNTTSYNYGPGGQLSSVVSASGESVLYDYSGNLLTQVRTVTQGNVTATRVHYGYDTSNRLASVTVDLSPADNSIADGKVYLTTYTYDGTSKRVSSVTQPDGSKLEIGYVLQNGEYRVASVQDALGQTTSYSYDLANSETLVTDPLGVSSRYRYNGNGELTQVHTGITAGQPFGLAQLSYEYNGDGNVTAITDGLGNRTTLAYDTRGNLTLRQDPTGATVMRTYSSNNELLAETVTDSFAGPSTLTLTSRYVYHATSSHQLRFALSAEGRVTENRYNAFGQRVSTVAYTSVFDMSVIGAFGPTEAQMQAWAAGQNLANGQRTDYSYDFRGQLATSTTYAVLDAAGNGSQAGATQYVFSQAGELLQTIAATGGVSTWTHDGLGRVLVATAPSSDGSTPNVTVTDYNDALGRSSVTLANGLNTLSVRDAAGRLVSVTQTNAGTGLGTTLYGYDHDDRLVMVQDPTGVKRWMVYDAAGRKVADVDGTGAATEYVYNANNQLAETISYATALANVTSAPTLASIHALAGSLDRRDWRLYDSDQRLAWQVDALGHVTQTSYDANSRIVSVTRLANAIDTAALGDATQWQVQDGALAAAGAPPLVATAVAVQVSQSSVALGSALTITASVLGEGATGTVTFFYNGSTVLGTATLVNGAASLTLSNLPAGPASITARYGGNATDSASGSPAVTATVLAPAGLAMAVPTQPVTLGTTIALAATIARGGAGGTVTFFDGAVALGSAAVQGGTGTSTAIFYTSALGLGSHSITAVYSGDPLTSAAQAGPGASFRVVSPTAIALSSNLGEATAGAAITLTATVTPVAGQPAATGSVGFYSGATLLGSVQLANGSAVLTTTSLAIGVDALTAVYSGDNVAAASTSATLEQVVLPVAGTTVVLLPSYAKIGSGSPLRLDALVAPVGSGGGTLSGLVTFSDGATVLGTAAVANGLASFNLASVAAGDHAYRAAYAGDPLDGASSSASVVVSSVPGGPMVASPTGAAPTVGLSASAATIVQGSAVTFTANAGAVATGSMSFVSGGTLLGTVAVTNGVATLVVSNLARGANAVQASYSGDATHPASASASAVSVTVTLAPTQFALGSSSSTAVANSPVVLTAQLTGANAARLPSGIVTFYSGATAIGTATLGNGIATLSTSALAVGDNSITVSYAGDTDNAAGTSAVFLQRITPAPAAVSLSASATTVAAGSAVTLTAAVGGTGATGTVIFFNGQAALGTANVVNGVASLVTTALTNVGTASVSAVYSGDAQRASAASAVVAISVMAGGASQTTSVALTASSASIPVGGLVTFSASVTDAAINAVSKGVSLAGGMVTRTTTTMAWDASVRSTVGYTGGASVSFVATQNSQYLAVGLNTDPLTDDSLASIDWAMYLSGGAVYLYQNGSNGAWIGSFVVGDTLSVTYDGSTVRYLKNGGVLYQQAAAITQPLYLDTGFYYPGAQIGNLQFRNGAGQGAALVTEPTGSVTFFNGQTNLGTAALVNGVAALTTTALTAPGGASITAVYSGDTTHVSAASGATAVSVAATISVSASGTNVTAGAPVTLTANVAPRTLRDVTVLTGVTQTGSTLVCTNPNVGGSVRSTIGFTGGASVSFVAQPMDKNSIVGLNTDPATDDSTASIDWAMWLSVGGVYIYQNGAYIGNVGTYSPGDVMSVTYDGSTVKYLRNGVILNQQWASIAQPLYLDSAFNGAGYQVSDLQFSKYGAPAGLGTVTFFNGQANLGTAAIVNGVTNLTTTALTTNGTANISAVYSGDSYTPVAASTPVAIGVTGATGTPPPPSAGTPVNLSVSNTSIAAGAAVTIAAAVGESSNVVAKGVSLSGGAVSKTSTTQGWDASIRSTVGFTGGASVSFVVEQASQQLAVGLNSDPATDDNWTSLDWGMYLSSGSLYVMQSGSYVGGASYSVGDTLSVAYDGSVMRYLRNGVTVYQQAVAIAQPLYLDSGFYSTGIQISGLQFKNAAGQAAQLVPAPTGSVTFFNGQVNLGTVALVDGAATLTTSALTVPGTAGIRAAYSGDATHVSALSSAAAVNVTGTVTLNASSTNVTSGAPVTLTANVAAKTLQDVTVLTGLTQSGTTLVKSTPTGTYASIRSTVGFTGGASVSFVAQGPQYNVTVGLNTDPATDDYDASIDWGMVLASGGLYLHLNGQDGSYLGSYAIGDTLAVTYDGSNVSYLRNGGLIYQQAAAISQPLYLDSSFYSAGSQISDLKFKQPGSLDTGSVTFFNGQANLGTAAIVNGVAAVTTTALTSNGTANITAVYSGDSFNPAAVSTPVAIGVTGAAAVLAPTTTTLTVPQNTATRGDLVTLTANVTGGGASPTGKVTFFNGTTLLGVASVANGVASLGVTALPVGPNALKAVYSGDAQGAASTSSLAYENIVKATPTVTARSSVAQATASGATVTLSARVSGVSATGTVIFYNNGTAITPAIALVNGIATYTGVMPAGTINLAAQYSGDVDNNNALSPVSVVNVRRAATVAASVATPGPVTYGTSVTLSATAPYSASSPGSVTFYAGGLLVGIATVQANGTASVATTMLPVGSSAISAVYSGNADYEPITQAAAQSVTVTGVVTNTALTVSRSQTPYGANVALDALVTSQGWSVGSAGTVTFKNGSVILGTVTISGGRAWLTLNSLPTGANQLTAVFNGNAGYAASTSGTAGAAVVAAPSAVTLSTSAANAALGSPVLLTAQVTGVAPGGVVTFSRDGVVLGTGTVANGIATLSVSNLPAGSSGLLASYGGDARNVASASALVLQTVTPAPATQLTRSSAATVGQDASIAIAVAGVTSGGIVTLLNGTTVVATAPVVGGVALLPASGLTAGTLNLTASYSGDATHTAGLLQFSQTITASLASTSMALTRTPTRTSSGNALLLSATVSPPNLTGSVTFYGGMAAYYPIDSGWVLGTATLSNGSGAITIDPAALVSTEVIFAVYSGDATHATSKSAPLAAAAPAATTLPVSHSTADRTTQQVFDRDGLLLGNIDGEGYLTEFKYDAAGRQIHTVRYAEAVNPVNLAARLDAARQSGSLAALRPTPDVIHDQHTSWFYDASGRHAGQLDAEGYLTRNAYDTAGNLIQTTRYAQPVVTIAPQDVTAATRLADLIPLFADPQDQTTLRSYDALNRLATETAPDGTITRYSYDAMGHLTRTVRAADTTEARSVNARYDVQGRLVGELSAQGGALLANAQTQTEKDAIWAQYAVSHAYDAAGRRISSTDQNGNRTLFFYDADNRLTHSVNALGEVSRRQYNALGDLTAEVDYGTRISTAGLVGGLMDDASTQGSGGATLQARLTAIADAAKDARTAYAYDGEGRLSTQTDATGAVTSVTHNAFDEEDSRRLSLSPDPFTVGNSNLTSESMTYDRRGLQLTHMRGGGDVSVVTSVEYDAFGRAVLSIDANQNVHRQEYDRLGRIVVTRPPLDGWTSTAYDAFDRVVSQTDVAYKTTTYSYDTAARSVTVTTPEGIAVKTISTRLGQTQSVTDGLGNTTTFSYDKDGGLVSTATPLTVTAKAYDRAHRLIETMDANGTVTQLSYDAANRVLARVVDPQGLALRTDYEYDAHGSQISVTDPNRTVTRMVFDLDGRLKSQAVDPAGLNLVTSYTYDTRGSTLSVTDPNGTLTKYVYDSLGRRTSQTVDPSGTGTGLNLTTRYEYDGNGNMVRSLDGNGQATRYVYDAQDRLIYKVNPLGEVEATTYDILGRVVTVRKYAQQLVAPDSLPAHPTKDDVLRRLREGSARAPDTVQRYFYDADGRLRATVDGAGSLVTFEHDAAGNVIERTAYVDPLAGWSPRAEPTPPVGAAFVRTRTVYDALGRTRFSIDGTGAVTSVIYDANGNVIERIAYANRLNLAASPLSVSPTEHELELRLVVIADRGRDGDTRYVYDAANRLARMADGTGSVTQYLYDANGNLKQTTRFATPVDPFPWRNEGVTGYVGKSQTAGNTPLFRLRHIGTPDHIYTTSATERTTLLSQGWADEGDVGYLDTAAGAGTTALYRLKAPGTNTYHYYTTNAADRAVLLAAPYGMGDEGIVGYIGTSPSVDRASLYELNFNGSPEHFHTRSSAELQLALLPVPPASPDDQVTVNTYDAANRLLTSLDAVGAKTTYAYDGNGNAIRQTRSAQGEADRVTRTVYDAANRETVRIDGEGAVTEFQYDGAGNRIYTREYSMLLGAGALAHVDYLVALAGPSSRAAVVDLVPQSGDDRITRQYFDAASRLRFVRDANLFLKEFGYDGVGRMEYSKLYTDYQAGDTYADLNTSLTNDANASRAEVDTFDFDAAGNQVRHTDANRVSESYEYDALGRKKSFTNKLLNTWHYEYDAAGRVIKETSPVVRLTRIVNAQEEGVMGVVVTTMEYDGRGNLTSRTEGAERPEARTTGYQYDTLGRQVRTLYAPVKVYTAESAQVLANNGLHGEAPRSEADATNLSTETIYDALGNAIASRDMAGSWSYKTYDKAGRVVHDIDALGYVTGYERNAFGEVKTLVRYAHAVAGGPDGQARQALAIQALLNGTDSAQNRKLQSTYDREGRVVEVKESTVFGVDSSALVGFQFFGQKTTRNAYNAFGEVRTVTELRNATTNSGAVTTYYYDRLGRQTHIVDAMGYLTKQDFDAAGNLVTRTEFAKVSTLDAASGRPVAATDAKDRRTGYHYDLLNRKFLEERFQVEATTTDPAVQSAVTVQTWFDYDAVGNLTSTTDAKGGVTTSWYDALGRVYAVVAPARAIARSDGSSVQGSPVTEFRRDALGNNVVTIQRATPSLSDSPVLPGSPDDRTSWMFYDKLGRMTGTQDAAGHVIANSYDAMGHLRKTWQTVRTLEGAASTLFQAFEYDKLGQQTASIVPLDTASAAGIATTTTVYNAFGEVTRRSNSAFASDEEYFDYDNSGRVWRTNSGDGVDKIYLYDLQGRQTVELRSAGKTDDVDGNRGVNLKDAVYGSAQAALLESYAHPTQFRRTDKVYDALGRVVQQIEPGRAEALDQKVTVQANPVSATITASRKPVPALSTSAPSASNEVKLTWQDLSQLGAGDLRLELTYMTAAFTVVSGGTEVGPIYTDTAPVQKTYVAYASAEEAARGYTLSWLEDGSYYGGIGFTYAGISQIKAVTVQKKNIYGEWAAVYDLQAPAAQQTTVAWNAGITVDVGFPAQLVSNTVFEYRPDVAGLQGDQGWITVHATAQQTYNGAHRFKLADQNPPLASGTYQYRVTSTGIEAGETWNVSTGTFQVSGPPVGVVASVDSVPPAISTSSGDGTLPHIPGLALADSMIDSLPHKVIRWPAPTDGSYVTFEVSTKGQGNWFALPVFTAGDGRTAAPAGMQEAAIDGVPLGTYQYRLTFQHPATSMSAAFTSQATGEYTLPRYITAAIPSETYQQPSLVAPIKDKVQLAKDVVIDGNPHAVLTWTPPPAGTQASFWIRSLGYSGAWSEVTIRPHGPGQPLDMVPIDVAAPGTYEYKLLFKVPGTTSQPPGYAQATGQFTLPPAVSIQPTSSTYTGPTPPPTIEVSADMIDGYAHPVLYWANLPAGVSASFLVRNGGSSWTSLQIFNSTRVPGFQEVPLDNVLPGVYDYQLVINYPASGGQQAYTITATGTFDRRPPPQIVMWDTTPAYVPAQGPTVSFGYDTIDGNQHQILMWPRAAGAVVNFNFHTSGYNNWQSLHVFSQGDGRSSAVWDAQLVAIDGVAPGSYEYDMTVEYPAVGGAPAFSTHSIGSWTVYANGTIGFAPGTIPPPSWDGNDLPAIPNPVLSQSIIDGNLHQVFTWSAPPPGVTVRFGMAGAYQHIYTAGDGRSTTPSGMQLVSADGLAPGTYMYELRFDYPATGDQPAHSAHAMGSYYISNFTWPVTMTEDLPPVEFVRLGYDTIDGNRHDVIYWPTPPAGAVVDFRITGAGQDWISLPTFQSGDGRAAALPGLMESAIDVPTPGTYQYQLTIDYPASGGNPAYRARSTGTFVRPPQVTVTPDPVPEHPTVDRLPILGIVQSTAVIDGSVHHVLVWAAPEPGTQVRSSYAVKGTGNWISVPVYTPGDGHAILSDGYQAVPIDIAAPGEYDYRVEFVKQVLGAPVTWSSTGTLTVQPRRETSFVDTTPQYLDPNGKRPVLQAEYDRWGNVLQTNDARVSWASGMYRTKYEYNANNQLIRQTLPQDQSEGDAVTDYYYDKLGRQVAVRSAREDPLTHQRTYVNWQEYDADGELTVEHHADGGQVTYSYDVFGEKLTSTVTLDGSHAVTTKFTYDQMARLKTTSLAQAVTARTYALDGLVDDANGNLGDGGNGAHVAQSSTVSLLETIGYDEAGRKLWSADAGNLSTTYAYDRRGNVSLRIGGGTTTRYAYDALDRKIREVDGNNQTQTWTMDYFGRVSTHDDKHVDAVGSFGTTYSYAYDNAGQLTAQTSVAPDSKSQNLHYTYDGAGQLVKIEDRYLGQTTRYTYDLGGRHLSETTSQQTKTASGQQLAVTYQSNHMVYDSQGRLRIASDGNAYVAMSYDKAGNRVAITTRVINAVLQPDGTYLQTDPDDVTVTDQSYGYDAMNRQTSGAGFSYEYDYAGHRTVDTTYRGATLPPKVDRLTYDGLGRLQSVARDGAVIETRAYDASGHLVYAKSQGTLNNDPNAPTDEYRYNVYDAAGRLAQSRVVARGLNNDKEVRQFNDTLYENVNGDNPLLGYDAAGNLLGYQNTSRTDPTFSGGTTVVTVNTMQYEHIGGRYQQVVTNSRRVSTGQVAQNVSHYDANGFLVNTQQDDAEHYNRTFVNDAQGHVLYVNQGAGAIDPQGGFVRNGTYVGGYIGTQASPGHVQRQLIVNGEMLARYGDAADPTIAGQAGTAPRYVPVRDFTVGTSPIDLRGQGLEPTTFTVSGKYETLQSIAKLVLGDERLWYTIAEANGLAGSAELVQGQTLIIPGRPLTFNGANTFRPYDPSNAIGDLNPALPALPTPSSGGGCGGMGQLIMIIVAVIATIYTAGAFAAAGAFGNAAAVAGAEAAAAAGATAGSFGATMAAGGAVLSGAAGASVGFAAGFVSGAIGSVAGQVVGNAIGAQDGFSWRSVALSAISGGASGGIGGLAFEAGGFLAGRTFDAAMVRAALGNAAGQAIGVVTGLQQSFNWRSVAASAVGAGVGEFVGGALRATDFALGDFGNQVARGTLAGFAAGATAAVARGGRISVQQVAVDAFGNALGQSIAESSNGAAPAANTPFPNQEQMFVSGKGAVLPDMADVTALNRQIAAYELPGVDPQDFDLVAGGEGVSLNRPSRASESQALHRASERQYRSDLETIRGAYLDRGFDPGLLRSAWQRVGLDDARVRAAYGGAPVPGVQIAAPLPEIQYQGRAVGGATQASSMGWREAFNSNNSIGERFGFAGLAALSTPVAMAESFLYAPFNVGPAINETGQFVARARLQTDPDARNMDVLAAVSTGAEAFSSIGAWLVGPRPQASLQTTEELARVRATYKVDPLYDNPLQVIQTRVDALRTSIPENSRGRITMAVGVAEDSSGARSVLIGTSEPRGYVRPGVTINEGEVVVGGAGHAEADVARYVNDNNLLLIGIGATRPVCIGCATVLLPTGAKVATPFKYPNQYRGPQ